MATLSVFYIVRNEQDYIKKSIDSITQIADEIIVVDTGSMDKTLFVCRQFPKVKVSSYQWVHDFSKVRNFALEKCTMDWVLYLDADELIDRRSLAIIKRAIDSASPTIAAFSLRIDAHDQEWSEGAPICDSYFEPTQIRLFRKNNAIRFEGKVRESARKSIETIGSIDLLDAHLHHFLWRGKGEQFAKLKLKYYSNLGAPEPNLSTDQPPQLPSPAPKKEPEKIAVVMTGFNCLKETQKALLSLQKTTQCKYDLYFTVNGSTDNSINFVKDTFPYSIITAFSKNEGAPKGKNASIMKALQGGSEYICVCDNDIQFTNDSLEKMARILDENPAIGAVGPLSMGCEGTQSVVNQFGAETIEEAANACSLRKPPFLLCDFLAGFCMMIRSSVLRRIGFFEESFGLYGYDDQDFCLRLKKEKIQMAIANQSYVDHSRRKTLTIMNVIDWHSITTTSNLRFRQKWNQLPLQSRGISLDPSVHPSFKTRVSIVILTHNRLDMTKDCLESIQRSTKNYELIIVDNASTDGTVDFIKNQYFDAKVIRNTENVGIPKARNQGIVAARSDFIVLMDNDVIVRDGWMEELLDYMNKDNDIVGIEAWQINKDFEACHKCSNHSERFDYLGGACCIYRKAVFERIGLLDEGFSPAYYEDVDICIRARKAGFKLTWLPTVKIKHREHATLIHGQKNFNYQEALRNSYIRFAAKMKGQLKVEEKKLDSQPKKLRILYLGMEYDYGEKNRGLSFEHDNFYPALMQYPKAETTMHFDFVDIGQNIGIPRMSNNLYDAVQKFCPDVLFSIFFDENHDPLKEIISKISKTTPTKTINWFCDSHYRYPNFDSKWAPFLDHCVTTSTLAMEWYKRDGFGNKVIKSQWGFSPKYKHMPWMEKDIPVSFVGQPHGDRRQVIDRLRVHGIPVQVYGTGWGKRLSFDEMIQMFNRSKINLNLNNGCDARAKQIKGRNFEVPGCGGFLLTGSAENLSDYYLFNKEIGVYGSESDMIEKIRYYLEHNEEREQIAKAGMARTMSDHTYEKRFDHIFQQANLI